MQPELRGPFVTLLARIDHAISRGKRECVITSYQRWRKRQCLAQLRLTLREPLRWHPENNLLMRCSSPYALKQIQAIGPYQHGRSRD